MRWRYISNGWSSSPAGVFVCGGGGRGAVGGRGTVGGRVRGRTWYSRRACMTSLVSCCLKRKRERSDSTTRFGAVVVITSPDCGHFGGSFFFLASSNIFSTVSLE